MDRDLLGYGANPPNPNWPGAARLAVDFVLNFEEGSERSIAACASSKPVKISLAAPISNVASASGFCPLPKNQVCC